MSNPIFQPVIEILQKNGATENEIADTIGSLIKAATIFMYQQAMETFSDEEMQQIESASDDEQANKLITNLYAQKMGSTPEELTQLFVKQFITEFIEKNKQQD